MSLGPRDAIPVRAPLDHSLPFEPLQRPREGFGMNPERPPQPIEREATTVISEKLANTIIEPR